MIVPAIIRVGRCFLPRRRSSKWYILVFFTLLMTIAIGLRSGLALYIIERIFLGREYYTKEQLAAMIPFEIENEVNNQNGFHLDEKAKESKAVSQLSSSITSHNSECKPIDPHAIFAIRIAKCASTFFAELLRTLTTDSPFDLFIHPSGAFDWDSPKIQQVASLAMSNRKRFIYSRHFYYADFRPYDLRDYTYITLMREPVARFVSSYTYYHFSSRTYIKTALNPSHKNESLMDCLEHRHEGCACNLMTRYFCGNYKFCKLGNDSALRAAKENLRNEFVAVGLVEEMEISLKIFMKTLPMLFSKLDIDKSVLQPAVNKNEKEIKIGKAEREAIQNANLADVLLYQYARKLLFEKARSCGLPINISDLHIAH